MTKRSSRTHEFKSEESVEWFDDIFRFVRERKTEERVKEEESVDA